MIVGKLVEKSEEESLGGRLGYNAATDKFEDLVAAGVIDPVKVGGEQQDFPAHLPRWQEDMPIVAGIIQSRACT